MKLTRAEATEFLEATLEVSLDTIESGCVEAWAIDLSVDQVRADLDSFLAGIDRQIDPASISITPDMIDETIPATHIFISTSSHA